MWGPGVMHKDQHAVLGVSMSGNFAWSTGETTSSITIQPACKDYSVFITTPALCTYSAQKKVTVDPPPTPYISAYKISEFSAQLQAGEGLHYQWTPSDGLSCHDCRNPVAWYTEDARYCVKTTDAFSCVTNTCISLVKSAAYIPNGFTPNDDRLNEVFLPVVTEVKNYQLKVYDRSGQKLFETSSPEVGWDGRFRGQPCERGVYVYALEFTDLESNRFHQYSGTVTLVR
jgi:gliding motility-associated-like protein